MASSVSTPSLQSEIGVRMTMARDEELGDGFSATTATSTALNTANGNGVVKGEASHMSSSTPTTMSHMASQNNNNNKNTVPPSVASSVFSLQSKVGVRMNMTRDKEGDSSTVVEKDDKAAPPRTTSKGNKKNLDTKSLSTASSSMPTTPSVPTSITVNDDEDFKSTTDASSLEASTVWSSTGGHHHTTSQQHFLPNRHSYHQSQQHNNSSSAFLEPHHSTRRRSNMDWGKEKRGSGTFANQSIRNNINVMELTINKLQYDSVSLVGRQTEMELLQECLRRITTTTTSNTTSTKQGQKELIFIHGYSGVGKTSLVNHLEQWVQSPSSSTSPSPSRKSLNHRSKQQNNNNNIQGTPFFAKGKFDLNNFDEPYAGISAAFREICHTILLDLQIRPRLGHSSDEQPTTMMETTISHKIAKSIGNQADQVAVLCRLIPELQDILDMVVVGNSSSDDNTSNRTTRNQTNNHSSAPQQQYEQQQDDADFEAAQERLKFAFCVLTRVLTSHLSPLVIFLDDLQWVDPPSIKVIDYLISDTLNTGPLMIVACYRTNEVDESHILSGLMQDLRSKQQKLQFHQTEIELQNIGRQDVNKIISSILATEDEDRTMKLSEIVQKRTLGNPYFVIQFITMLEEEEMITFNLGKMDWEWQEDEIAEKTMSTANVVDLVQARMNKLPPETQLLLAYATCLGSTFSHSTLNLLWTKHAKRASEDLQTLMKTVVDGHFVELVGSKQYRWVHDKVQEAALALDNASSAQFQFEIGSILYRFLGEDELELMLFEVVDLINRGDVERSLDIAALTLRAAEKAREFSAFGTAAKYAATSIACLPSGDKWTTHSSLTLRCYTVAAEMELALGHIEAMEAYTDEVLLRQEFSAMDKLPLYMTKALQLCNVESHYEASVQLCLDVLKELDFSLEGNKAILPIKAISSLFRVVRMAKRLPKGTFEKPKMMTDRKQQAVVLFLSRLFYSSYHAANKFLLILSATQMVQLTIKYGISPMSGTAYATLGLLTTMIIKDFSAAARFAETALLIQKSIPSKYTQAIAMFTSYHFILPWTMPLQRCIKPLHEAHSCGMQSGNTEVAMEALVKCFVFGPYQIGRPLNSILMRCPDALFQMDGAKQSDQSMLLRMFWQMMLNLTGASRHTIELRGEVFDCDSYSGTTPVNDALLSLAQLELLIYFGELDRAAEKALAMGNTFEMAAPATFLNMLETFHRGIALFAMARRTKKAKYRRPAKQILKTIQSWISKGNPNVRHYEMFLSAQHDALKGDYRQIESKIRKAIATAAKTGYLHDAALFNELYAHFLNEIGDKDEAMFRIDEAIRLYTEWGADAKVEILSECKEQSSVPAS